MRLSKDSSAAKRPEIDQSQILVNPHQAVFVGTGEAVGIITDISEIQVACFRLGEDLYAVDIMRVKEIVRPQKLTCLPKGPVFIEGVINLRGIVIPVIDLHKRFDMAARVPDINTRMLIVKLAGQAMGLVVDEVTEVITIAIKDIQPPPNVADSLIYEYLLGVCLARETLVMLLNIDKLLTHHEVAVLGSLR